VTAQALRAGAVLDRPSWDSLGSWHFIASAPDVLAVGDVHPAAEVLASQERPDLMITARTLLDHGGDVARAAEELHIHRTTLYYRIERIEALTGVNLKAGPGRDDLHMALRLAAFRSAAD
jgi:PucR-like helix-turn-helix protein